MTQEMQKFTNDTTESLPDNGLKIWFDCGVCFLRPTGKRVITRQDVEGVMEGFKSVVPPSAKVPLIGDFRDVKTIDKDARQFISRNLVEKQLFNFRIFVSSSPYLRIVANLIFRFSQSPVPFKFFDSVTEALEWLDTKGLIPTPSKTVNCETVIFKRLAQDFVICKVHPDHFATAKSARETYSVLASMIHGHGKILLDVGPSIRSTSESRSAFACGTWANILKRVAFVVPNQGTAALCSFFISVNRPPYECRVFSAQQRAKALRWLDSGSEKFTNSNSMAAWSRSVLTRPAQMLRARNWPHASTKTDASLPEIHNNEMVQTINLLGEEINSLEKKFKEESEAKSDFLSNICHDIRSPLSVILGFAEMLPDEKENPEKVQEYADIICRNSRDLLAIVGKTLNIEHILRNERQPELAGFDTEHFFTRITPRFSHMAEKKRLKFAFDYDKSLPSRIVSDATKLRQIIVNLLENAIKYTQSGSVRLLVKKVAQKDYGVTLEISVVDTGRGIPKDQIATVQQPFKRGRNSTGIEGTGVGLAIVRAYAELLGGVLNIRSTEGKGTKITMRFVCNEARIEPPRSSKAAMEDRLLRKNPKFQSVHVLVVDDEADLRALYRKQLEDIGFTVDEAADAESAIRCVQEGRPNFVFMDMQLPGKSGLDAVRHLRRDSYDVPIVLISANMLESCKQDALDAGCNDFLQKPIPRQEMIETIRQWTT